MALGLVIEGRVGPLVTVVARPDHAISLARLPSVSAVRLPQQEELVTPQNGHEIGHRARRHQPREVARRRTQGQGRQELARDGAHHALSFRGDALVWLRLSAEGRIARCHVRDASWFQWPLLEAAIEGNIVADFPLCNKSFNCSYAGHDL